MGERRPKKEDWDTMLASLEAAFLVAGIPIPLKLAGSVVAMIKRHWTNDGRLEPEYEQEKALQLVEEAIEPLAGAHLEHADDLDKLKQGQDQIVTLILRVLRETEARANERDEVVLFEGPRRAPAKLVPFFRGRDDELAELEQLLLDNRTVCVVATGIGGIGKTVLAEEFVATRAPEQFPDGVAWLDGRELIAELGRVARRFGWADEREATPTEALSLLGQQLHTQRFLLVVDNFDPTKGDPEHVPNPGGQCRTLVTSRSRPLAGRLVGAQLELGVWDLDACRQYLRERCPRLLTEADADVDGLAKFVGRLPLGVRLLVSVLNNRRSMGAAGVLTLLEQQPLGVLDKYEAERGVAATFQVSYEALTDVGRRVLQALGVCAKQTRAEVVGAVVAASWPENQSTRRKRRRRLLSHADVLVQLDELYARGIIEFAAEGGPAPWGLHDVMRLFVLEQPERKEFEAAHEAWVRRHIETHSDPTAHREFSAGVDEARVVFERLVVRDPENVVSVYLRLQEHLRVVGRNLEAIAVSEAMLAAAPPGSVFTSNAMIYLGIGYQTLGDIPKAIELQERALGLDEKLGNLEGQAAALGNLGGCYRTLGDIPKAIELQERALGLHEKLGLDGPAAALRSLGGCYQTLGDIPKAIELHERALGLDEKLGRLEGQAAALGNLGLCYRTLGDIPKAIELHERALGLHEKLGRLEGQAAALGNLGTCYQTLANIPKAIELHERALGLHEKLGGIEGQATALGNLGGCYQALADIPKAIELHERALVLNEQLGRLEGQADALGNLGGCYQTRGDIPKAIELQERALGLDEKLGRLEGQAAALGNMGGCYQTLGDIPKAIELLERALSLDEKLGRLEGQAITLGNLGVIAIDSNPTKARYYLTRALELFDRMGLTESHPHVQTVADELSKLG